MRSDCFSTELNIGVVVCINYTFPEFNHPNPQISSQESHHSQESIFQISRLKKIAMPLKINTIVKSKVFYLCQAVAYFSFRWSGDVPHATRSCICFERKKSSVFFKHHLTVTALTDPGGRQTRCLWVEEGAGWMGEQGSIEVRRQRWREMHTRGSLKGCKTRGRR